MEKSAECALKKTSSFHKLTVREREVLDSLAKDGTAKGAAQILGLSHETVRVHMKKIYQKLHVKTKAEALLHLAKETSL